MKTEVLNKQKWMLIITFLLWGFLIVRYPHIYYSIPLQFNADRTVVSALNKNVFIVVVFLGTIVANVYTFKRYTAKSHKIMLSFLIPYILFVVFAAVFFFLAGR